MYNSLDLWHFALSHIRQAQCDKQKLQAQMMAGPAKKVAAVLEALNSWYFALSHIRQAQCDKQKLQAQMMAGPAKKVAAVLEA